jgi:23S rRNA maturation-related 3'-5' exoribonuclease YhaM
MRIRIEKIAESETGAPANPRQNHVDGQEQEPGYSLPLEYTIEGDLIGTITVGKPVVVDRDTRNGIKAPGLFTTTAVQVAHDGTFKTRNSVYNFQFLET